MSNVNTWPVTALAQLAGYKPAPVPDTVLMPAIDHASRQDPAKVISVTYEESNGGRVTVTGSREQVYGYLQSMHRLEVPSYKDRWHKINMAV
jgi:hypothetical protein